MSSRDCGRPRHGCRAGTAVGGRQSGGVGSAVGGRPNSRAQAFYRKHGFVADGSAQIEGGVREIRMVRGIQPYR